MALPDKLKASLGTAVIWGHPAGAGVTKNLSLNNLATLTARMGVYADLGALFDVCYLLYLVIETGTAPVAGTTYELFMAETDDVGRWPGKVDGTDAAYAAGAVPATKIQLGRPKVVLPATADLNTTLRANPVVWYPVGRYAAPVIVNNTGQNLRNETTPADNDSRVIAVPQILSVED